MDLGNSAAHTLSSDTSFVPITVFFVCETHFTRPLPLIFATREIDDDRQKSV